MGAQLGLAQEVTDNPTYSSAVFRHQDPHEYLFEIEADFNQLQAQANPALRPRAGLGVLALAAKAALEAGENQKAHNYALKALAMADQEAEERRKRSDKDPRLHHAIPTADYYANFVLGRLAVLSGDIRSAEYYLIASGKTLGVGDAVLHSYGPNMSLALEVLKHGDQQSRQTVLQFLEEIKVFWPINPKHFQEWSAQIAAGKIPNFQAAGPNLYN